MRLRQIVEGGWDTDITQGTVIHPSVVKTALIVVDQFLNDFNRYLAMKNMPPMKLGHPTGSSAYYKVDEEDKIYGDIDIQFIVSETGDTVGKTQSSLQTYWYKLEDDFVKTVHPKYVHPESPAGHPLLKIAKDKWVQVDMMIHPESLAQWGRYRVTPERGMKGLIYGNVISVFGELLNLSIQHSGIQYKVREKQRLPFVPTRSNYEMVTISSNIETFILDTFEHEAQEQGIQKPKIDPLLAANPGVNINNIRTETLINAVKGFAKSCELNGMFGKGNLTQYDSAQSFLVGFLEAYEAKVLPELTAKKRDKATTPEAIARAESDRAKIMSGLSYVQKFFKDV